MMTQRHRRTLVCVSAIVLLTPRLFAQQIPLSPAPMLGLGKDADGRPLPFGVPPYFAPDTPLGSGPFKAAMTTDAGLPEHVIYAPANLDAAGKLPIVSWGNGACIHAGNRFRTFLTEIASHGFLVISAGRLEDTALEVGPQENPVVRRPGDPPPPPAIAVDPNSARARRSTVDHMRQAIDWALAAEHASLEPVPRTARHLEDCGRRSILRRRPVDATGRRSASHDRRDVQQRHASVCGGRRQRDRPRRGEKVARRDPHADPVSDRRR